MLCGAGAEFALLPQFGTSTYFLLTTLALADFLSGIALRARRGVPVPSGAAVSRRSAKKPDVAVAEPRFDPVPEPAVPARGYGRRTGAAGSSRAENSSR